MSAQTFLARIGLRLGTLGADDDLAIAAPLGEGDVSVDAHTDAERIGVWFDRTTDDEAVVLNVMGSDILRVGVAGVVSTVIGRFPASTTSSASLRLPHGTAPSSPVDGDIWTTTAGLYARIDGASVAIRNGTVTSIVAGTGLDGGTITATGTISLADTAVVPGAFTRASITVDQQGRITAAASGADIDLAADVTGTLPIANGGTGQVTAAAAMTALSPLTTKGDLLSFSTLNARLAVGTAGQVLTVDSGEATGLIWATPTTGTVTGTGVSDRLAFWDATSNIAGDAGLTYDSVFNALSVGGFIFNDAGSVAAPSYSFTDDEETGLYLISIDSLGVAVNGINRLTITPSAITSTVIGILPASTTGAASIRLPHGVAPSAPTNGDLWTTTSGLYARIDGVSVFFSVGGVSGSGTTNQVAYWDGSTSVAGDAGMVYSAANNQLALAAGTALLPGYSIIGDLNTGIYGVSADRLGFAAGGDLRLDISTTAITSALQIVNAAGTVSLPGYSITGDTDSGIYGVSANRIGIATNGILRFDVSTAAITSTLQVLNAAGSASLPGYAFSTDTNTGWYSIGADHIGAATGGTLRFDISTTAITSTLPITATAVTAGAFRVTSTGAAYNISIISSEVLTGAKNLSLNVGDTSRTLTLSGSPTISGITTTGTGTLALGVKTLTVSSTTTLTGTDGSTLDIGAGATIGAVGAQVMAFTTLTAGAILYGSATNTAARLAPGTDTYVLTMVSGAPAWAAVPAGSGVSGSATTNQVAYWTGSGAIGGDAGMVFDATNNQIALAAGTAALPGYSIIGDLNTGIYGVSADKLGFTTGGTLRFDIASAVMTSTIPLRIPYGTAGVPSINFSNDTGIYNGDGGGASVGIAASGTFMVNVDNTGLTMVNGQIYARNSTPNNAAGAPGYSFTTDTNTGIFNTNSDDLKLVTGGTTRLTIVNASITSTVIGIFPATTTGAASIRLPHGTAPTSPTNGDIWTTTTAAYACINGSTVVLGAAGGILDSLTVTQAASTGTPSNTVAITPGGHTALTASTEYFSFVVLGVSQQFATGALTTQRYACIAYPTYSFVAASTLTSAATLAIVGAPDAGLNCTITNAYALWVQAGITQLDGDVKLGTTGKGIYIKEGSNATSGVATLSSGTVVVNTTKVTANSRIQLTGQNLGTITVPVGLYISARTPGTSFTILSGNLVDTSDIAWTIIEPA